MNTMTAERPPAKAPRMRYPEQALAELKSEDPNTPVTVYMIRRLVAAGTIPSIRMVRVVIQHFLKTIVVQFVFEVIG